MLVPAPLLIGAQTVINRVLSLDPESLASVSELEGQVIKIEVTGPDMEFYLMFLNDGVELTRFYDSDVDSTVTGSVFALMSLLRNSDALFDGSVKLSGSTGTVKQLKKIMDDLDVDWEEQLSGIVGDGPSHQLFRLAGGFMQLFEQGAERVRSETSDFLQNRAGVAVAEEEVREFCDSVDTVRNDVDRLEARIARLENSSSRSVEPGTSAQ